MGAGKNKSHRKKRISKHVLQAEERRKIADVENKLVDGVETTKKNASAAATAAANANDDSSSPKTLNASTDPSLPSTSSAPPLVKKTKNPQEVSTYLSLWKYDQTNKNNSSSNMNKQWKFNKNTQSWLLRHMYNPIKVPKHTFALLVEYLLHGRESNEGVTNRVLEDAKFRARRYKEFEKQQQQQEEQSREKEIMAEKVGAEECGVQDDIINNNNKEEGKEINRSSSSTPSKKAVEVALDLTWKEMDEHEKRKEYKRARKVLDAFKEAEAMSSSNTTVDAARDGK